MKKFTYKVCTYTTQKIVPLWIAKQFIPNALLGETIKLKHLMCNIHIVSNELYRHTTGICYDVDMDQN